jgi:O-antigen/teichoic acid export membrane protein
MKVAALRALVFDKLTSGRFLRNSSLLMLANMIVMGLAIIRTPTMTWLLPKEAVGMIGAVSAWIAFVQLLSLPGMDTASYHYLAKRHYWAFGVNLNYRLRWSLLSTVALLLGAWYWYSQGSTNLAWMFVIAGLSFPVTIGLTAAGGVLGGLERFTALFWYRLGESITDFAGFLPLLLLASVTHPAALFYGANQVATALMMISVSWWLWRQLRTQAPAPDEVRTMVRYGQHMTAISGLSVAQAQFDSLLVTLFLPLTVVADYLIATVVSNQFKTLWGVYTSVRYPVFMRMTTVRRRRQFLYEGALICLGFVGAGVVGFLVIAAIIPWLLPPSYTASIPYIAWLIPAFLLMLPGAYAEMYFRTEQDQRRQYIMRIAALVVNVAASLALAPRWGITGIIAGRLAASGAFSVLGFWLFLRFPTTGGTNEMNSTLETT